MHSRGLANLMTKIRSIVTYVMIALVFTTGCQQLEPQKASSDTTSGPIESVVEVSAVAHRATGDPKVALREAMANYVAPYPHRQTLFFPPKDAPKSRTGPVDESDVQLRGLVNVGQPQAILDIEGATALVGVGHEKLGVRVVSIEDHEVVLQRGPTRWTASLD